MPTTNSSPEIEALAAEQNELIDQLTQEWPKEVRDTDPGRDDTRARYAWMKKSEGIVRRLRLDEEAKSKRKARSEERKEAQKRMTPPRFKKPGDVKW